MSQKLSFSGHESFYCKHFWLKKGYDFIKNNKKFSEDQAVVDLGVGKNMVSAISFWVKAFDIIDPDNTSGGYTTEIAKYLFSENGKDPFIEDIGSIWLLHYHLVQKERASIYNLVFNKFRLERFEFTKMQLHNFLKRECQENGAQYNKNTVDKDINVFLKNYVKPDAEKINVEEDFVGLLMDLNLIQAYQRTGPDNKKVDWYKIESDERIELPCQIVLYSILNNENYGSSISFRELLTEPNSPGLVFCLNAEGLHNKIEEIANHYSDITFTETAGNQVLQLNENKDKFEVLNDYYK